MAINLFPHQVAGAAFLSREYGTKGLFFGMGTGKTLTSIYAARRVGVARMIVIAPPIALPMWQRECTDHMKDVPGGAPYDAKVQILKTGTTAIQADADVVVVSYAIAAKRKDELKAWLHEVEPSILICDESHALKSVKAQRTKAILGNCGLADGADYTWLLTGTPITRWNDDMFPFLCRADLKGMRKLLGGATQEKFLLKFTIRQKRQFAGARFPVQMVVGNRNTDILADFVYGGGHAIRVDLDEVFQDMPPLTTNRYDIKLDASAELRKALKEMEKHSIAEIKKKLESKEPALATIRHDLGLAKVKAAAAEIAERVESGQNILVGAWHTDVIDELKRMLTSKKYKVAVIDGRTSTTAREHITDEWNDGEIQVLVGQIAAMGVSLNLQQGGNQIIVVEEDWSPSVMDQFYARLWRYGQQKHVHVDILQSETKLDKALGRISSTKAREHSKFNEIGREYTEEGEDNAV